MSNKVAGQPLDGSLTISGAFSPYSVSVFSGTAPTGVSFSVSGTSVISSGNVMDDGTFNWTLRITSTDMQTIDSTQTITALPWTPSELFKNSEKGSWYDPSDYSFMSNVNGSAPISTLTGFNVGRAIEVIYDQNSFVSLSQVTSPEDGGVLNPGGTYPPTYTTPVTFLGDSAGKIAFNLTGTATGYVFSNAPANAEGSCPANIAIQLKFSVAANRELVGDEGFQMYTQAPYGCYSQGFTNSIISTLSTQWNDYTYTTYYRDSIASQTNHALYCGVGTWTGPMDIYLKDVSVKYIQGNHAWINSSGQRPTLSARRNFLYDTSSVGDTSSGTWSNVGTGPTVTLNDALAPNGNMEASTLAFTVTGGGNRLQQFQPINFPDSVEGISSIYLRGTVGGEEIVLWDGWGSQVMHTLTTSWQRYSSTAAVINSHNILLYANSGTPTIEAAMPQSEMGNVATLYQRSKSETDYDTNFPKYLDFDGVDDNLGIVYPSSLSTDCTIARSIPNIGAEILTGQTVGTDYTIDKDFCAYIIVDRALTADETTLLTNYLNTKAGL